MPDLIIIVREYTCLEHACRGNTCCVGGPFTSTSVRWEAREADFYEPAAPMLSSAPIVFVRGDHEQCDRAGAGFFRFLHPFRMRQCLDFTKPYAIDFKGLQLIVMDTVQAIDTAL